MDLVMSQVQLPVPPTVWEKTGVRGLGGVGLACYHHRGQVREIVFLDWPTQRRGLLGPFWQQANVRGALAVVPSDVTSFGVGGIDLAEAWSRIRTFVQESFPPAAGPMQLYVNQFEGMLGVRVPELLAAFGSDFVSYTLAQPGGAPKNVILVSLRNGEFLRRTIASLEKQFGKRLLSESVDAVPIFATPGTAPVYFVVCEQYLGISQDVESIRDFVRNRRGRRKPLGSRSDVKDILGRADLAGLSYVNLGHQLAYIAEVGVPQITESLKGTTPFPVPIEALGSVFRELAVDVGDVWALCFVGNDGVSYEVRSNFGVLPFGVSAGSVAGAIMVPAVMQAQEKDRENAVMQAVRSVAAAQEIFRVRNGRYAQNLWELRLAMFIDAELGRGYQDSYLFKVKSSGANDWWCDARPVSTRGRYFYCDQTGIIRAEQNRPARAESPVATGATQ
jgi:hypothetical protein